jgi:hypothetical protein
MAFAYTKTGYISLGNKNATYGTFTNSSSTGGDIYTGLQKVELMFICPTGAAVTADAASVNETLPCSDPVTIVTTNNAAGNWMAIGF